MIRHYGRRGHSQTEMVWTREVESTAEMITRGNGMEYDGLGKMRRPNTGRHENDVFGKLERVDEW